MIKRRKKIAAMLVASMILVTSLPNTAEAFRLQHRKRAIMIVWMLEKNAFEKHIKNIQACYNRKKRRTVFMQLKGGQCNG